MKNNKKPLMIIVVVLLMIVGGLLLANYMFKQVDINLEKNETSHSIYFEPNEYFAISVNVS